MRYIIFGLLLSFTFKSKGNEKRWKKGKSKVSPAGGDLEGALMPKKLNVLTILCQLFTCKLYFFV
jgi:hypothetical protein